MVIKDLLTQRRKGAKTQSFYLKVFFASLILCTFALNIYAKSEKIFNVDTESEAILNLTASTNAQAIVTVFIDDKYHHDIILFAGNEQFVYKSALGRFYSGTHKIKIEVNKNFTTAPPSGITLNNIEIKLINKANSEFQGIAHSPILYARPNTIGKFTDIPLLMYYESLPSENGKIFRYTAIFTNEDGGTQTSALMARWGRTTDIELVNETFVDNNGVTRSTIYQGVEHETKGFKGKYEADHPLLGVASDNNNFADDARSEMRFALLPVYADLSNATRESVMDSHPWIYRFMVDEMIREGKITEERTLGLRIADLRNFLYLDVDSDQTNGALLSFAVKLKGQPQWYTSNLGIGYYNIERSGKYRTSVRLPQNTTIDQIESIAARCDLSGNPKSVNEIASAVKAQCRMKAIHKIFMLDKDYQPAPPLNLKFNPSNIPFGEMTTIF